MDKTKYNRAAKDASQLQQFVDEVCEAVGGNQDSLHVTVKDTDGDEAATFDVAYDNGEDNVYAKLTSLAEENAYVSFDSFGDLELSYYSTYMRFEPEVSTLYVGRHVGSGVQESLYHFMSANEDGTARNGEVVPIPNAPIELTLTSKDTQLDLSEKAHQILKINFESTPSSLEITFPSQTWAVTQDNFANNCFNFINPKTKSANFSVDLNTTKIGSEPFIIIDLTNPIVVKMYAVSEV